MAPSTLRFDTYPQVRAEKLGEETNAYELMQTLDEEMPGDAGTADESKRDS